MKNKKIISVILTGAMMAALLCGCESQSKRDKNMEAYRQYGQNCLETGEYEDAVNAFQKALDESSGRIGAKEKDLCYYKAEAQFLSGDTDAAMETYNALIDYDKKDANAYYLRGNLYFALGDSQSALADFEQAVSCDSKNYELYIGICDTLTAHDMEEAGVDYLNKALQIKGDSANDNLQRGRIYYRMKDMENAQSNLKKALDAGNVEANFYLAQVCEDNGDSEQAASYVQAYLDSGTVDSQDLYQIGKQQLEKGKYEQAATYFEAGLAMESVSNKQALMKNCIVAYEKASNFEAAKTMMSEYISEYPEDSDAVRENIFLQTR